MTMMVTLGTGLVSWPNSERIAGRYGMIALFRPGNGESEVGWQPLDWDTDLDTLEGLHGSFVAFTRNGQQFDLGTGTFFTEQAYGITYIGLKPDEPREEDWLNVDNLYKVDGHLTKTPVDLCFVPVK